MKIYRTTRYGSSGRQVWQRLSTDQRSYGNVASDLRYGGGYVTLEVAEVDEIKFEEIKSAGKVPVQ